jgi:3D (Asp-Asp-Asp) domain-containing protein
MKKVFRKTSKVVLPVIATGGILFLALTEKTNEEDTEYRQVESLLENSVAHRYEQAVKGIQREAQKRHEEFIKQDNIRMAKIQAKIDAEVAMVKEKDRQKEIAKQKAIEEQKRQVELKKQKQQSISTNNAKQNSKQVNTSNQSGWMTVNISYYGTDCYGCSNLTSTGIDVSTNKTYNGMVIIATDPRVIPTWSIVELQTPNGTMKAVALDRGGAIKGNKIDVLVQSEAHASKLGRHNGQLRIIGSLK